jgi:lysophospholipase L1-like esterase
MLNKPLAGILSFLLLGLVAQGSLVASDSIDKTGVVVLGASYAGGWQVEQIGGLPVVNKGVGGQESHEMLARFADDVTAVSPRYVILWGFINDIFRTDLDRAEERLGRSREDYRQMVALAREAGIQPVLATEITMARPPGLVNTLRGWLRGKPSYRERVNRHVISMNEWIREFGRSNAIPVLDFEAVFQDGDLWRRPAYATADGSHVTAEGYRALTVYVEAQWPAVAGR